MESALEDEEFFVVIQPKYSPDGQRVLGGEALVRWRRPGEGMVSPGEFVPLFEQNGFIIRLDEFVFERTCRYLRERLDAGEPVVPVSANVSRLHLHRPDFVETYARIKDRYRIPDGMAELEVTESIVLEDLGNARRVIAALQARGFSCSIDDFGSGESSLNALKDLPVDVLKLDRAFLFGHDQSLKEDVVVRTVIDMAGRLQMKTVMEGVETPEQLAFLQNHGLRHDTRLRVFAPRVSGSLLPPGRRGMTPTPAHSPERQAARVPERMRAASCVPGFRTAYASRARMFCFGWAPTACFFTWPPSNTMSVGTLMTP